MQEVISLSEMHQRLVSLGKLKRQNAPEAELILELFRVISDTSGCTNCPESTLIMTSVSDEFDDLKPRRCESCNSVIPRERLEVFPDTVQCTSCADSTANNQTDHDYCPRCGDKMKVSVTSRGGLTKYISRCTGCGYEH